MPNENAKQNNPNISSPYHLLVAFCDKLNTFSQYDYPPQKFIESAEWKKIMMMANEVLQSFNHRKIST